MNVCIVRFTQNKKVLLVKNKERGWEFPGGKIDVDKDRYMKTTMIDIAHTASREFYEEVGRDNNCVGHPINVLFEPTFKTVFFVYKNQKCLFDNIDKLSITYSKDPVIEEVKEFSIDNIEQLSFSFDKDLITSFF